jgi:hypothetical protein
MQLDHGAEPGVLAAATAAGTASLIVAITTNSSPGPWLAFAGALFVAILTAVFAQQRQQAALEVEDSRQDAALQAERERLEIRLAHDRRMVDTADLRVTVEAVLSATDDIADLMAQTVYHEATKAPEMSPEERKRRIRETGRRVTQAQHALWIRIAPSDPLAAAISDLATPLTACLEATENMDTDRFQSARYELQDAGERIQNEAQRQIGSAID